MNYCISIMLFACIITGFECAEFPTSYAVIESDKIRLLDFIYEPAEAAPGDTVLLTAIFAGKKVSAEMLEWSCSRKIVVNEYGVDAVFDTIPLETFYVDTTFSENTSGIAFTFVIPPDFLEKSPYIPDNWTSILPDYYRSRIPSVVPSNKYTLLCSIDSLSHLDNVAPETIPYLGVLLQCLSAPMYIYCDQKNGHTIQSEFVVRYNRRFASLAESPIRENRNPRIDSAVMYTVEKANLAAFNPFTDNFDYSTTILRNDTENRLLVDKTCSYFIAVFTDRTDSVLSIDASLGQGVPLPENHFSHWYLHFDDDEVKQATFSEQCVIDNGIYHHGQLISRFYPPRNKSITSITTWVEVNDGFVNERSRPAGSTIKEYSIRFAYK